MRKTQKMPAAIKFVRDNLERVFPGGRHSKRHTGMFTDEFNAYHGYEAISTWTMKYAMDTVCEEVFGSPDVIKTQANVLAAEVIDEPADDPVEEPTADSGKKGGGLTVQKVADLYRMQDEGVICPVSFEDAWPMTGETRGHAKARLEKLFPIMVEAGTATLEELVEISINFEGSKGGRQQGKSFMMSLNVADQFYADMPGTRGVVARKILIDGYKENEQRKRVDYAKTENAKPDSTSVNGLVGQALQMIGGAIINIESRLTDIDGRLKKCEARSIESTEKYDESDPYQMISIRAYAREMRHDSRKNRTYGINASKLARKIMAEYESRYLEEISEPILRTDFCLTNGTQNFYRRWMLDEWTKDIFTSVLMSDSYAVDIDPILVYIRKK